MQKFLKNVIVGTVLGGMAGAAVAGISLVTKNQKIELSPKPIAFDMDPRASHIFLDLATFKPDKEKLYANILVCTDQIFQIEKELIEKKREPTIIIAEHASTLYNRALIDLNTLSVTHSEDATKIIDGIIAKWKDMTMEHLRVVESIVQNK